MGADALGEGASWPKAAGLLSWGAQYANPDGVPKAA